MTKDIFCQLKGFKYVLLHPHGIGDLIISMPYIRWVMEKRDDFSLCVKDEILLSGFFKNFSFKERIFGGCPSLFNKTQTIKNYKKLNELCKYLKDKGIKAFYVNFNKYEDRRYQARNELSKLLNMEIPFNEDIHGEVYINEEIDILKKDIEKDKKNICFLHTQAGSFIKSVIPQRLKKFIPPGYIIFTPSYTNNININFAAQFLSKKNIIVDSVYMHSAGALGKDIDVLFVSLTVKKFIFTLLPKNIKIHKIIYGNFFDIVRSFIYYAFLEKI